MRTAGELESGASSEGCRLARRLVIAVLGRVTLTERHPQETMKAGIIVYQNPSALQRVCPGYGSL
jgi:hypothetical protein